MKSIFSFLLVLLFLMPSTVKAAVSPWQRDNDIGVRLIAGVDGTGSEAAIPLALEIDMAPGWHTYWRSPGPLGLPPQFDWKNSQTEQGNLDSATLLYPAPIRFGEVGFESSGYRDHVVMPIEAHVKSPGKPLVIDATLDLLACSTMCVPKHFTLNLTVPAGEATPSPESSLITAAREKLPDQGQRSGITVMDVQRHDDTINVTFKSKPAFANPHLFVENDQSVSFKVPELISNEPSKNVFVLRLADKLPDNVSLKTLPITVTLADGNRAIEQTLDPAVPLAQETQSAVQLPTSQEPVTAPLWVFVVLAVLGGFVLNLTPCVLPVLSLKVLSVVGHGGGEHKHVRRSFLMTAAGIMFSFLVLAGVTMVLKETGQAVGWGVQFQQPVFLVLLVLLLTLFAANLWDLYEIPLPRFLADRIDPHHHPKLAGDFFTGAFATLLATPCSAPFLGTAVGFALTAGSKEILVIFASLGLGMMLPYLAVALLPGMATLLPRPGKWMLTLRRIMGTLLVLTAAWLVYVLANEVSFLGVLIIATSMIGVAFVLYLQRHTPSRLLSRSLITALIIVAFIAALKTSSPASASSQDVAWQKFDEKILEQYISEGKTVFVDITADWCVNCKVNKQFTLGRDDIKRCLFKSADVIAMRADWTNPNSSVAQFLKRHGRYGIPFNAIYGPAAPKGVVLPEILTPGTVKDGLTKAHDKPYAC